jgi:mono/diheme cytochrome c family protein
MTISVRKSSCPATLEAPLRRGFFLEARKMRAVGPLAGLVLAFAVSSAAAQGDPKRGEYLAKAAGCVGCHTETTQDAPAFAGGRALKTPFGTFYGPNITPHPEAGIGKWTEADFVRAMRLGERPDGANYFPAFPYPSFTGMSDEDLRHLWAYLRSLPLNSKANRAHDLGFPYGSRWLVTLWKWLYFTPGPLRAGAALTPVQNRGRYLVHALGHCGECHTPRTFLGGPKKDRLLGGGKGPEDKQVPNITPARLESWSDAELKQFLLTGDTPDGDSANETMAEVVRNTTSQLSAEDLAALIAYLRVLPAVPDEPKSK